MSTGKLYGDETGILLWEMMMTSIDKGEKEYFQRIASAASKYRVAYFTDIITQRETCKCEPMWQISWNQERQQWKISSFSTPHGSNGSTARIDAEKNKVMEVEIEDLITD